MRNTTVLVLVTATLSDVLEIPVVKLALNLDRLLSASPICTEPTDLTTGPLDITVVLKLKGPMALASLEPFCATADVSAALGLKLNDDFVGLRRSEGVGSSVMLRGNDSLSGDKESRSTDTPGVIRGAW